MKLKKILAMVLCLSMVLGTMGFTVLAEDTDIVEVGTGKTYETWSAAIAAATDDNADGAITYHVYGKVLMDSHNVKGAAATINIIGMTEDAELSVETANSTDNGVVYLSDNTIETVNFINLTLSRPNGAWRGNEGHHNRFFTVWDSDGSTDLITYTNCVFPNGAGNNQYGKTTYTDCTFNNDVYYALWIYGSGDKGVVEVTGCTFDADRGVKIYSEDASATVSTTITNSTFDIASKPAIVSSIAGELVVEEVDATACEYGLLASEPKDGRSDLESAEITVDGEEPVFVAQVGNMVCTDMAYAEAEATDSKPIETPVAKIGTKYYTSLQDAIDAVGTDETIVLCSDIHYDNYVYAAGKTTSVNVPADKEFTLDLNGYTISGESNAAGSFEMITVCNGAILTIDDTSEEQSGTVTFEMKRETPNGWMDRAHTIFNQGTLILNGGTIVNTTPESQQAVSSAVDNNCSWGKLGTFIMNGGVVNSVGYYAVRTDVNTHNTTAGGTNKAITQFNGGTVYGFYLMDRGSDVTSWAVNDVEFTVGHDAIVEPTNYSGANGTAIRLRYGSTSTVAVEISEEAIINGKITGAVARVGSKYYKTLAEAIEAAADGNTIVLLGDADLASANIKKDITIDLNDNTLTVDAVGVMDNSGGNVAAIQAWADVTITNGDVVVTCENAINNGIFYVAGVADASLTISDVNLTATNTNGTDVFVVCNPGTLNIVDSTINASGVSKLVNGGDGGNATITGTEINVSDSERVMVNIALTADESEFVVSNLSDNAFRNVSGTINNTVINADGYENGIKNDAGLDLAVTGNSVVTLTGAAEGGYDLHLRNGATLTIEETATFEADDVLVEGENAVTGDVVSKADSIYVQYKKVDVDADGEDTLEGSDKYEIVLAGVNEEKINELASADLTFNFVGTPVTGGAMDYAVAPAEGVSLTQLGDRFMFNYDGVTKYEESGVAIVIGTITINGYGSYTLATAVSDYNAVYATEIRDNIVDGFEDAATLVINVDLKPDDGMVGEITDGNIAVPTRTLTVKIDFPNAVEDNAIAYQDMKVEITGNIDGVNKTVTYNLGTDEVAMADGSYVVEDENLVLNNAYTVTVSGAGYRTARYTVTMTEDKTLRFWNNVMDEAQVVEIGKASSGAKVTFLAGDIVKDNNINIYDLSAVVSYFGTEDCVNDYPEYAKYDLNRDGVIDSKDVAYVLVSWNN